MTAQTYATHRRAVPLPYTVALGVLLVHVVVTVVALVRHPSLGAAWAVVVAMALVVGVLWARVMAQAPQDRVIRLEEQLRLQRVLPPADAARAIAELRTGQLIALRFAPDAELPDLVRRTLAGEFAAPEDIKRAVRDWRADHAPRC
jgi:hypothetical protein